MSAGYVRSSWRSYLEKSLKISGRTFSDINLVEVRLDVNETISSSGHKAAHGKIQDPRLALLNTRSENRESRRLESKIAILRKSAV